MQSKSTSDEIDHLRAEELRMVAGLLEKDGQLEHAAQARENALLLDPVKGNC